MISVATDDLLHGGEAGHWQNMEWLNQNYKLGKFTSGNGRFVGKEINCLPDGSILVNQPIYTQEKANQIPITRERAIQKMSQGAPRRRSRNSVGYLEAYPETPTCLI